jgi:hypothetical protein
VGTTAEGSADPGADRGADPSADRGADRGADAGATFGDFSTAMVLGEAADDRLLELAIAYATARPGDTELAADAERLAAIRDRRRHFGYGTRLPAYRDVQARLTQAEDLVGLRRAALRRSTCSRPPRRFAARQHGRPLCRDGGGPHLTALPAL